MFRHVFLKVKAWGVEFQIYFSILEKLGVWTNHL